MSKRDELFIHYGRTRKKVYLLTRYVRTRKKSRIY